MCNAEMEYLIVAIGMASYLYAHLFWVFQYSPILFKIRDVDEGLYLDIVYGKSRSTEHDPNNSPHITSDAAFRCYQRIKSGEVEKAGVTISRWYHFRVFLFKLSLATIAICFIALFVASGCS